MAEFERLSSSHSIHSHWRYCNGRYIVAVRVLAVRNACLTLAGLCVFVAVGEKNKREKLLKFPHQLVCLLTKMFESMSEDSERWRCTRISVRSICHLSTERTVDTPTMHTLWSMLHVALRGILSIGCQLLYSIENNSIQRLLLNDISFYFFLQSACCYSAAEDDGLLVAPIFGPPQIVCLVGMGITPSDLFEHMLCCHILRHPPPPPLKFPSQII